MSRRGCHQYKYLREIPVHIPVLQLWNRVYDPIHGKTPRICSMQFVHADSILAMNTASLIVLT